MTSYPSQVNQALIDAHRDIAKLMPFIHLPIQSGSNKILKAMNRKYTAEQYLDVVDKLRKSRPDIAISSDFIVGFAGETDKDFEETLKICKKVNYATAFSFKYSMRYHAEILQHIIYGKYFCGVTKMDHLILIDSVHGLPEDFSPLIIYAWEIFFAEMAFCKCSLICS